MIEKISLGIRDLSVEKTHWREISDFQFSKTGKMILIMPGGTVRTPKSANGCIKRFQDTMGNLLDSDTTVFCAYYDDDGVPNHRLRALKKARVLNDIKASFPKEELPVSPDFRPFFNAVFLPILIDENKKARTVTEICEKLNRLILVSYCYGGFVSYEMSRFLEERLKRLKFSLKDRTKICKAFKVVACASRFPMQVTKSTVLHVVSYSDRQQERNWKYSNFHAFLNTRKKDKDKNGLTFLQPDEMVLSTQKLLMYEIDDHHYRAYFKDYSLDFLKTPEWENVSGFICEYIRASLDFNGKKSPLTIIKSLSNQKQISDWLKAGKELFFDFKAYVLSIKKMFSLQEKLIQNKQIQELRQFLKTGAKILPLRNRSGDFLIHQAIDQNDLELVGLVVKNESNWFQSFDAKGQSPILKALKQKNVDMAYFLWKNLFQIQLPVFESYHVLRNMQRKTFRGILLYVRKIPQAALLLKKILKETTYLPIKPEDADLILRHLTALKNKKESFDAQETLKACLRLVMEEYGDAVVKKLTSSQKNKLKLRLVKEAIRKSFVK